MKKLLFSSSKWGDPYCSSRVLGSLFSTKTQNPSSPTSLFHRIDSIRDPKLSILPVLDQWVAEGGPINQVQLRSLVKLMRDFNRFNHALQISDWMTDRRYFKLSPNDLAIRLDLISKVHGLEQAENYFNNISNNLKSVNVYGAILMIYARENSVDKAETIMQKMREMGMATSSFPYNHMIFLYAQIGAHDKIDILLQEMKMMGICPDMFTFKNLMNAYILASDIPGMEKILNRIEEDPQYVVDWKVYSLAVHGYLKLGLTEKALMMLKKMEKNVVFRRSNYAFHHLLTLYARTGLKDELYRVWNLYKASHEVPAQLYACMITSLAKLDDLLGAEKIFEEWESQCPVYDFRVLDRLLIAYCIRGLFDKAESVLKRAVKGRAPFVSTWHILAIGYMEHKQISKSVEMLKNAMLVGRQGWKPNPIVFEACLEYLGRQRDVEGVKEIVRLYKNFGPLTKDIYHKLLRTCIAAGRSVSGVLDEMNKDGFTADKETHEILEMRMSLCPARTPPFSFEL